MSPHSSRSAPDSRRPNTSPPQAPINPAVNQRPRCHERCLTLSGDEAAALLHVYELLGSIVDRTQHGRAAAPAREETADAVA